MLPIIIHALAISITSTKTITLDLLLLRSMKPPLGELLQLVPRPRQITHEVAVKPADGRYVYLMLMSASAVLSSSMKAWCLPAV